MQQQRTLSNCHEDGSEFDNSHTRGEPLISLLGRGRDSGFDSAVDGMTVGETLTITLTPDQAYGEVNPEHRQPFPSLDFQKVLS